MDAAAPNSTSTKWVEVTSALKDVVSNPTLQGPIKWGLEFFPSDSQCAVTANIAVPVATNTGTAITNAINGSSPAGGGTPTTVAIQTGADAILKVPDTNPKYLLLATDGEPNCETPMLPTGTTGACTCPTSGQFTVTQGANCCTPPLPLLGSQCLPCSAIGILSAAGQNAVVDNTVKAAKDAAAKGVNTFVIGVGLGSGVDTLNKLAVAGNTARSGADKYYPVSNKADLVNAISSIATQLISCTLALQMPPSAPNYVEVVSSGMTVPRDTTHANGWDFGPGNASIILYGTYCQQLQTGTLTNIQTIFGCPPLN
jgi:hypothetical protein